MVPRFRSVGATMKHNHSFEATEQFGIQFYPVSNLKKILNFGLGTVWSVRNSHCST